MSLRALIPLLGLFITMLPACDGGGGGGDMDAGRTPRDTGPRADAPLPPPPPAACDPSPGGGSATVQAPMMIASVADRWHESWLGSPAVADLDGDGTSEIIVARSGLLLGWHLDGTVVLRVEVEGRIWASPIVADIVPERAGLEVAFASRGEIHVVDASGASLPGFPFNWRDELRSLAAGDSASSS